MPRFQFTPQRFLQLTSIAVLSTMSLAGAQASFAAAPIPLTRATSEGATAEPPAPPELPLKVSLAPNWTKQWDLRGPGWVNSDGLYSIPLDREDAISSATSTSRTFWNYSDSYVGTVNPTTLQMNAQFINHASSVFSGNTPDPANNQFTYGTGGNGTPTNLYGKGYWLMDGVALNGSVYTWGYTVDSNFAVNQVDSIKVPLVNGSPDYQHYTTSASQMLYVGNGYRVVLGGALLDNTVEAGQPNPDGYIYVYGFRYEDATRIGRIVVSRFTPTDIENVGNWKFWDGSSWTSSISNLNSSAAAIGPMNTFQEFSVTPINSGIYNGKYMAIYSKAFGSTTLEYAIADNPQGPFSDPIAFYDTPEMDTYPTSATYNAKAHPSLSRPGTLLISYFANAILLPTSEIYRPRFLELDLNTLADKQVQGNVSAMQPSASSGTPCTPGQGTNGALDETWTTKWCDGTPGDKWLRIDLEDEYYISKYRLMNAEYANEPAVYNTRDWKVQVSLDGASWTDVDTVVANSKPQVTSTFPDVKARYVRLYISKATQDSQNVARVPAFSVYGTKDPTTPDTRINVALGKPVTASGAYNATSGPENLTDGNSSDIYQDKWVDGTPGDKWAVVDLGQQTTVSRWVVKNASVAGELTRWNTNYYRLQASDDAVSWVDVDTVEYNMLKETDREISPTQGRYFRLLVTKAALSDEDAVRIYELELYAD